MNEAHVPFAMCRRLGRAATRLFREEDVSVALDQSEVRVENFDEKVMCAVRGDGTKVVMTSRGETGILLDGSPFKEQSVYQAQPSSHGRIPRHVVSSSPTKPPAIQAVERPSPALYRSNARSRLALWSTIGAGYPAF
jgi:hypothetical protein